MQKRSLTTPRADDLQLTRVSNESGFQIAVLPNGTIFSLEHVQQGRRIMVNRSFGSPIAGSLGRLYLRIGGTEPMMLPVAGVQARGRIGAIADGFIWQGEARGVAHQVALQLQADRNVWLWRIEVRNQRDEPLACDALLIQDLGLGDPGFLMNNEAYASQYLDHHIAQHAHMGPILMTRQNLAQSGQHPWVAHGCHEGAAGYATDYLQLMGPAWRDAQQFGIPFGTPLPSVRLQHETACAALQSKALALVPGATASWTFFGLYSADHPGASADTDLALIDEAVPSTQRAPGSPKLTEPRLSVLAEARCVIAEPLGEKALEERYPGRRHIERAGETPLSFFTEGTGGCRHVVLRDKERRVVRPHGALLVSGRHMLPDDRTLCVTCWMHGVFGAQLTLGNTSFHRLWSIVRDPYNITRSSGLRILVDVGDGWQWLTVPSLFEIGLTDCLWVYELRGRTLTIAAAVAAEEPAVQWRAVIEGAPCRFLVVGQVVMGEREFAHAARLEIDERDRRVTFRPEPGGMWSEHYPAAVYHLVTSTPECIEAIGSDELLYASAGTHANTGTGGYAVLRTGPTTELVFAVVGSLTDAAEAERLAARYSAPIAHASMQRAALAHWRNVMRDLRLRGAGSDPAVSALDATLPWLVHDAMVHLTVPHGLEQYTGGAWGTRDVCQGPMELLLALEHDETAKAILHIIFAQQYAQRGDWPQWFMLEPYSVIQDREAHGDVIVWPLKALCDYVEATGDFGILDEAVAWRREDNLQRTVETDPIAAHIDKLIATVRSRFLPGTSLIRYGNGDWNDSLQPVDPAKRDWMVSSWTVALLYEQLCRYAEILRRSGRADGATERALAAAMRADFNQFLVREGTVAGYGEFHPSGGPPELLLHPADQRTGVRYSLLPMTQAILGALFTAEQVQHHLALIRTHLRFPDGVRLMDRPLVYRGGPEVVFRRAESAAFFGREIGLMYTHAHLRYAQAMALLGDAQEMWDALQLINPVAVTDRLPQASLRQRNTYFSSSDAAFHDRYEASAEWSRVREGTIAVEGGWRIYSSGPGLYVNMVVTQALGARRNFGARALRPCLPASLAGLHLEWDRLVAGSPPQ